MDFRGYVVRTPIKPRKRAVVKTLLYRACMILITIAVAWVVTGQLGQAVNIGIAANVMKTGTYYLYERAWDRVGWGLPDSRPT